LITNVKRVANPAKKEFPCLAPSDRVFRRWRHSDHWTRNVGPAGTRNYFYTSWSSHFGDRISMGQELAFPNPAMDPSSFQKADVRRHFRP
jgi:hypothetical protein